MMEGAAGFDPVVCRSRGEKFKRPSVCERVRLLYWPRVTAQWSHGHSL